ncbi:hypothetical protein OQH61_03605 [Helicobacter sp. MIT 21-1697]|nr:hypothetical protein [Helicobacter sp. MIT 21-1697]MCX2716820.1 hypothetical protein [Helicobacter sp. MIT 21-1697]
MPEVEEVKLQDIDAAHLYQYGIPILMDEELQAMQDSQNQALLEELKMND